MKKVNLRAIIKVNLRAITKVNLRAMIKEKRQVLSEAELSLYYQCLIQVRHRNRFQIFAD